MYLKIGQKAHKKMKKPRKTHTLLGLQANSRSKMTKKSLNYILRWNKTKNHLVQGLSFIIAIQSVH